MGKAKLFLIHSSASKLVNFLSFLPMVCRNFCSGSLDFHKGSLVSVFRAAWTAPRLGLVHRLLQCPQPGPQSVCLLPDAQLCETSPESLSIWCWIPQLPQRHFYPWMCAKFLLSGRTKTRDILYSHDADILGAFLIVIIGKDAYWHLVDREQDAAKHPTWSRQLPERVILIKCQQSQG